MYRTSLLQPRNILSHLRPFGKCFLQKITIFLFYFLCFVNSRIFCARCTISALFAGGKLPRAPLQHQYGQYTRGLYLLYKGYFLSLDPLSHRCAMPAPPASVLALSGANAPALPKGEPLAKPVTWHLSRKLYRHAKASPFGRGGSERSELTERARLLPRSAAASTGSRRRKCRLPPRPLA